MTTPRLTRLHREKITKLAVEDAISADRVQLQEETNDLIGEVILRFFQQRGEESAYRSALKLPPGWIRYDSSISVRVGNEYVSLEARGVGGKSPPKIPHLISIQSVKFDATDKFGRLLLQLRDRSKELESREKMLTAKVGGLIANATTPGALEKLWPEGEPYYREILSQLRASASQVPAVRTSEINRLLGIPKERADAA